MGNRKAPKPAPGSPGYKGPMQFKPTPPPPPPRTRADVIQAIRESEHPWAQFLAARQLAIHWMFSEGKSPDEIARALSCDGDQVLLISIAPLPDTTGQPKGKRR